MKKIIFILMLMFSLSMSAQSVSGEWKNNTFVEAPSSGKYIKTPYSYIDSKGVNWGTVFVNKENGRCKVSRKKPDGKTATKYLSEEVSKEYCTKMNISYTYVPKKRK